MPFGVELPDNLGQSTESADPKPSTGTGGDGPIPQDESVSSKADKTEASPGKATAAELLDLDKLERFRFQGKEWSPKDLRNAYLMREDYTRKTQEVAQARKFAENYHIDAARVIENPALLKDFRAVYPKHYQDALEKLLSLRGDKQPVQPQEGESQSQPQLPKEVQSKILSLEEKFASLEREKHDNEVKQLQNWLDNQFETLSKKYPSADPEVIMARAEVIARQGTDVTDKVLDRLFKTHDQEVSEKWEKRYKSKVDEQLKAGSKGKDVGSGGGIPGGQPRGFKTIKEATAGFLKDIAAN